MIRESFNEEWLFSSTASLAGSLMQAGNEKKPVVTLPHDATIHEKRSADCTKSNNSGFYPGGVYVYTKKIHVPEEYAQKSVMLEFEGVATNAKVYINGDFAGKCPYPYSGFYVKADRFLKYGIDNEIKVVAKSPTESDSRWYCGGGIYRNVYIMVGELLHIVPNGVRISTPDIDGSRAVVEVRTTIECAGIATKDAQVLTEILDASGNKVATDRVPVTAFSGETVQTCQRLYVERPVLWSVECPNLYRCKTSLLVEGDIVDEDSSFFGIRKLQLDTEHGLRINGETLKLRGACIHHDNGVVGACSFERAEERRVKLLKEAGFNALRSSHHPMSKAMLDACDRLGMLVMDETFDMWHTCKTDFDFSLYFEEWWEYVVEDMVRKDYNHPCVIMYSIGNEIPETGTRNGVATGRKIAEKVRALDTSRYVTNSVNGMMSIMDRMGEIRAQLGQTAEATEMEGKKQEINDMMSDLLNFMRNIMTHDQISKGTEEAFSIVDIAGYNYMTPRYPMDNEMYPNRVIVGSETFPPQIAENWRYVKQQGNLIGDFTWTGWDYIGESGVGKFDYTMSTANGIYGPYPWYLANCGDIDITGTRRPISYYREIVWGLRKEPYIAVQKPQHYSQKRKDTAWCWSDSVSSWTWPGFEGSPVLVEVYADADEVELILNGISVGKAAAGEENAFKAEFEMQYVPGNLTAVAYVGGSEVGRWNLMTAGKGLKLAVDCDRQIICKGGDLAYIMISLTDENGILQTFRDRKVSVSVDGAGVLQGFGSADPQSLENFYDTERTTYYGKVLAVVRPTGIGKISVDIAAEECAPVKLEIEAKV